MSVHAGQSAVLFGSREKPRILLVEDDYQQDVMNVLKPFDHELVAAVDTFEAGLAAADQHKPELILMDNGLRSAKSGYRLATELIKKGFPKEQIIFISDMSVGSFPGFVHVPKYDFLDAPKLLFKAIQDAAQKLVSSSSNSTP